MNSKYSRQMILMLLFTVGFLYQDGLFGQQTLNLGFEKLSAEGLARPWGWNVGVYGTNTSFRCDSTQSWFGKHSLRIKGDDEMDKSLFELAFSVEPSQIRNKKVSYRGWAKTQDFQGEAGLCIRTFGRVGENFEVLAEQKIPISKSEAWQSVSLSNFELGEQLHTLNISIYFEGTGTVWFDEIELKLDGNVLAKVPVAPAFTADELSWITEQTKALLTPEPSTKVNLEQEDFTDLEYFRSIVRDAQIIALGEATHGTSEFFKMKHRLLQYAIRDLGVRVFILEDNQLLVERINDFVLYGKSDARTVIKGLFAVWNTQEMLTLIEWVRSYNEAHPDDKVEFVGMDVQNPALALKELHDFLGEKSLVVQARADSLLRIFTSGWRDSYFKSEAELYSWEKNTKAVYDLVNDHEQIWQKQATNKADSLRVAWAIQNARLIHQSVRSMLSRGFEGRDKAMAENVSWILNQRKPGTKALLWAHDSHISRGDSEHPDDDYFLGNSMGSHLSSQYKDRYCAFGLFTYRGTCRGTISYSNFKKVAFPLYTSPIGSLDEGLHQVSVAKMSPFLLMNLRPLEEGREIPGWLMARRPVRYVGYVAEDFGFAGRYVIPKQFDGIIFIDKSEASKEIVDE